MSITSSPGRLAAGIRGRARPDGRRQQAPYRPYLTLPNGVTACSLAAGLAVVIGPCAAGAPLTAGGLRLAAALIAACAVLDSIDGPLARARGQATTFGQCLDSLADLVAFGVAPAVMLRDGPTLPAVPAAAAVAALWWCGCAMFRLARFSQVKRPHSFIGVPVPAAAVALAAIDVASPGPAVVLAAAAVLGCLMASRLPFPTWGGLARAVRPGRP
jgi:CDP-diacylglycerol--serine O-phosphatidyltransferase